MELSEVLKSRRSVRKFSDRLISDEVVKDILDGAMLAPETDTCSYYFGVVTDPVLKEKLSQATLYAEWIASAPTIFVCCCDISWDIAEEEDDSYGVVGNSLRYSSKVVQFLRTHSDRKACKTLSLATPAYIAAQHMILTAVSHGLRGCLVDFINISKVNEILNLPDNISCQLLVPIGYTDEVPLPKSRRDVGEVVFYNRWNE